MCDIPDPPPPANFENHRRQDYQSLLMHVEAVRLLHRDPNLIDRLRASLERWRETADPRTLRLFDQWQQIIELRDWPSALSPSERGAQLRQASPMSTLLDQQTRMRIIGRVSALAKKSQGGANWDNNVAEARKQANEQQDGEGFR